MGWSSGRRSIFGEKVGRPGSGVDGTVCGHVEMLNLLEPFSYLIHVVLLVLYTSRSQPPDLPPFPTKSLRLPLSQDIRFGRRGRLARR